MNKDKYLLIKCSGLHSFLRIIWRAGHYYVPWVWSGYSQEGRKEGRTHISWKLTTLWVRKH